MVRIGVPWAEPNFMKNNKIMGFTTARVILDNVSVFIASRRVKLALGPSCVVSKGVLGNLFLVLWLNPEMWTKPDDQPSAGQRAWERLWLIYTFDD